MHPQELFKTLEDRKTEIEWARKDKTTPTLPKNIKYPKSSLDRKSMTTRTALYAFLHDLKP